MNVDIRRIIYLTIYTMKSKIVSYDYVNKYIELLEIKFNTKINLIYEDDFNDEKYDNLITTMVQNNNIYFIFKDEFNKIEIDDNLLIDKNLLNCEISNIDFEFMKQYKLNNILKNIPSNNIPFILIFKLFMLKCNIINKDVFHDCMYQINDLFNKYNIKIENYTKLELFRIMYQYPTYQKYSADDDTLKVDILDKNKYYVELAYKCDKNTFIFLNELIDWLIEYNVLNKSNEKIQVLK